MRRLVILLALVLSACGGKDSPVTPTIPAANLIQQNTLRFGVCIIATSCAYSGELLNTGTGCAANVRGTVEVLDTAGTVLSSDQWAWSPQIHPNETITVSDCCLNPSGATQYRMRPSWDNVACQ